MACGKPVVASRIGGLAEIVEDGKSEIFVPPENHDLLAEAIIRLLSDEALRLQISQIARQRIVAKF